MSIIEFNNRVTGKQLQYLEKLVAKICVHETYFKVNRMRKIVGRKVAFIHELTKQEASNLIDVLKKELGYE